MRSSSILKHLVLALGVIGAVGVATPQQASACGGGWFPEVQIDYRIQGVAQAEKTMRKGNATDAAASVIRMIPHIRAYDGMSNDALVARAQRILAVATAEAGGKLDVNAQVHALARGTWAGAKSAQQADNLEWSVRTLRAIAAKRNDPSANTDLGYALARAGHKSEALAVLGKLADKDLLASPEAYAELAQLRSEAGDAAGGKIALKRCQAMAASSDTCDAATAPLANS